MHIAWFKRDLRVWDNESFTNACKSRNVMPLYIIEPELWKEEDLSYRQYIFLTECLKDLDIELKKIGQKLTIRTGDALEIFNDIKNELKTHDLELRIQELESKFAEDFNQNTFDEINRLKKEQNIN